MYYDDVHEGNQAMTFSYHMFLSFVITQLSSNEQKATAGQSVPRVKRAVRDLGYQVRVRLSSSKQCRVIAEYRHAKSVNPKVLSFLYWLVVWNLGTSSPDVTFWRDSIKIRVNLSAWPCVNSKPHGESNVYEERKKEGKYCNYSLTFMYIIRQFRVFQPAQCRKY